MAETFALQNPERSLNPSRFKYRSRIEIVSDLLVVAKTGTLWTHLMRKANLSGRMTTEYLNFLVSMGLVEELFDPEWKLRVFRTTQKGLRFLEIYNSLQDISGMKADEVLNVEEDPIKMAEKS